MQNILGINLSNFFWNISGTRGLKILNNEWQCVNNKTGYHNIKFRVSKNSDLVVVVVGPINVDFDSCILYMSRH